jgi:hypothetical protein
LENLPCIKTWKYFDAPEGGTVEFRLMYRGKLPAQKSGGGGGRMTEKHTIRKLFHKQLRELWKQHPHLRAQAENYFYISPGPPRHIVSCHPDATGAKTWVEHVADRWTRCGGRFVPLISKQGSFTCVLNILFLRRDGPGNLISSGGDIDNRVKVLLDSLKMPRTTDDLGGMPIEKDENPFFCLLEDDSLITDISVTTDRLLLPQEADENIHDVALVVHVTMVNPSVIFAGNLLV